MTINTVILGASGYVGGELLRLVSAHPELELAAAVSRSQSGSSIAGTFPHLAAACGETVFVAPDSWIDRLDRGDKLAIFSAAPHGSSAAAVQRVLESGDARSLEMHVVDSSADFRYAGAEQFERHYATPHAAPELMKQFFCAVPEHEKAPPAAHVGHPGCFATAALLAAVPLAAARCVAGDLFISGITGSTGSGRKPGTGTHHPERHSNLYAYKPLAHRHVPEIRGLIEKATGARHAVNFVPHSGPFSRGIYITLQAKLDQVVTAESLRQKFRDYYAEAPFVRVVDSVPRLKNVVASNFAELGVHAEADTAVIACAIDNLVKGAAGGAIQWMNRLWSLPEQSGLLDSPPAWT